MRVNRLLQMYLPEYSTGTTKYMTICSLCVKQPAPRPAFAKELGRVRLTAVFELHLTATPPATMTFLPSIGLVVAVKAAITLHNRDDPVDGPPGILATIRHDTPPEHLL